MVGIGDTLKHARSAQNLTLKDMQRKTNIQIDYLEALEAEQFEHLPSPFYTRGFLRAYAKSLKLDSNYLLHLYENAKQNKQAIEKLTKKAPIKNLPAINRIGDPRLQTTQIQVANKLTISQIETFTPRREIHRSKWRNKNKRNTGWMMAIGMILIFSLVGLVYFSYK